MGRHEGDGKRRSLTWIQFQYGSPFWIPVMIVAGGLAIVTIADLVRGEPKVSLLYSFLSLMFSSAVLAAAYLLFLTSRRTGKG